MIEEHKQYNLPEEIPPTPINSAGIYDAPNILALQKALSVGVGDDTTTLDPKLGLFIKNMRTNLTSQYYIYNTRTSSIASIQDFTLIDVANKTHKWPNQSGTIAMTSDIPSNAIASGATGTTVFTPYAVVLGPKADNLALQDTGTPAAAGTVLTSNGAGTIPTFQASSGGSITLLKASDGSSINTSANNLDTVAISGLTSKDTLIICYTLLASAANCGTNTLYSNTDSSVMADLLNGNVLATGKTATGEAILKITPGVDDRNITAVFDSPGSTGVTLNGAANTALVRYLFSKQFTTNFTGSWTLALRNGGVTAGGTLFWGWQVYKLAGQ